MEKIGKPNKGSSLIVEAQADSKLEKSRPVGALIRNKKGVGIGNCVISVSCFFARQDKTRAKTIKRKFHSIKTERTFGFARNDPA